MIGEGLRMALGSLWSHKMRSFMTIMGVVIGISSVLAVTSLGAAFEESITSEFDSFDDRSIFVTASVGNPTQGPPDAGQFGLIFTEVDRQFLEGIEGVERAVAGGEVSVTRLSNDGQDLPYRTLVATTPDADEVRTLENYAVGGPFELGENEVVLGSSIATKLEAELGDEITIRFENGDEQPAEVVGILAEKEGFIGTEINGQVYVPVDPYYDITAKSPTTNTNVRVYSGFTVFADDARTIKETQERVAAYMQEDSDAKALLQDDLIILVSTPADITAGIGSAFDQITLFIAGIAGVSLLVGGIMIGTIMLISVTERTKEIGMMKAIGARDREVLTMFMLEASIIGLLGSIFGILLGVGAGAALIAGLFGDDVSFIMPWNWVLISVLVGVGVGILAGILPARRAVKIEPVEALSYE